RVGPPNGTKWTNSSTACRCYQVSRSNSLTYFRRRRRNPPGTPRTPLVHSVVRGRTQPTRRGLSRFAPVHSLSGPGRRPLGLVHLGTRCSRLRPDRDGKDADRRGRTV